MYKILTYCFSKARLGVLRVSLCIYLVFAFFRCHLTFLRVDLAFFAYDYLATLITWRDHSWHTLVITLNRSHVSIGRASTS